MTFKVLYLKEHVENEPEKVDTKILILYDEQEETFYYYSTRQRRFGDKYIVYNGMYHYTRFNSFLNFLKVVLNQYIDFLTVELHDVVIYEHEYDTLDFYSLAAKMNRSTEIVAYDKILLNENKMMKYVDMLISHEI